MLPVPEAVAREARLSLLLKERGYEGGKELGLRRADQLAHDGQIDDHDVVVMHAWFARHRITSRPKYLKWVEAGRPVSASWPKKGQVRGAVAWLLWGGEPGYEWIRTNGERRLRDIGHSFRPLPVLSKSAKIGASPKPAGLQRSALRPKRSPKKSSPKKSSPRRRRSCGCSR